MIGIKKNGVGYENKWGTFSSKDVSNFSFMVLIEIGCLCFSIFQTVIW